MSDYDNAVLADSPSWYVKGTEPFGSTEFADSSGNGHDVPVLEDALLSTIAGPIETDNPNQAAKAEPTDVGGFDFFGIARYEDPLPSEIDPRAAGSYEAWGFCASGVINQVMVRNGNIPNLTGNALGLSGTTAVFKLKFLFDAFTITRTGLIPGFWYHLVLTWGSGVMRAYLNSLLIGEEPVPSGEEIQVTNDNGWLLGIQFGTDACPGASHWAVYDHALSFTRVAAHYEAAISATLLNGRADAYDTAVLHSAFEPDPTVSYFRHNWDERVVERLTWSTGIGQGRTGPEEAAGAVVTPRREVEYVLLTKSERERRRLRARLETRQASKWYVPIEPYKQQLTESVSAGGVSVPFVSAYSDVEEGGQISLYSLDANQVIDREEIRTISAIGDNALTVDALENDWTAYQTYVRPVRRGYLPKSISLRGHTDAHEDLTLQIRLLAEDEKVVPHRIIPYVPTTLHQGYPILLPSEFQGNDWTEPREYELERDAEDVDEGFGVFSVESDTPNAQGAFTYRMILEGRANIARLLGWFYARAGRKNYVWVPTMQSDFDAVSRLGAAFTAEGHDYTEFYAGLEARRDVAFVYHDYSMIVRRIDESAESGSNDVLTLSSSVPVFTNLRCVSFLKLCRLDSDAVEIAWETAEVAAFSWRFRELLNTPD